MVQCPSCRRHHRPEEPSCPFCRREGAPLRTAFVAGVASAALSLSACYGAPPRQPEQESNGAAAVSTANDPPAQPPPADGR